MHYRLVLHLSHHRHFILHAVDKVPLNIKKKEMWGKISIELYRRQKHQD
jgi:hypothetical protein